MQNIKTTISDTIKSLYNIDFSPDISPAPKRELGEYCVNIFPIVKQVGKAPPIISEEVANALAKNTEIFQSTSATGGYVNFFLIDRVWQDIFLSLQNITNRTPNGKRAIMENFSLNVGKPLHIGHLCPTSTGQAIINVYRYLGWEIIVDNHMGDWGSLFGKLIVGYERYGDHAKLEQDGVDHLMDVYVAISADIEKDEAVEQDCRDAFKKLSSGDMDLMKMWGEFTKYSLDKAYKIINMLHVYCDVAVGESYYEGLPLPKIGNQPDLTYKMDDIVQELIEKGIATKNDDGSVGIVFPEDTKLPSTILEKRDGTHGYLASDLACMKYRMTNGWNPDKIAICTDVRQSLHFKQVYRAAEMAGWLSENLEFVHVGNGFISLVDGAMSSRKGNIIRLEDVIEEGFSRTKKILEEKGRTGEQSLGEENIREIAIGAIKYSYLMQDRERNITFDWDKALNFEGNSGPYIQYAYVRASKLIQDEKLKIKNFGTDNLESGILNLSSFDKSLIRTLSEFDGVIDTVAKTYKPHHLALYAYDLAVEFNSFYVHTPKILEEKNDHLKAFRLALVAKTAETLEKGFDLLGIRMPSEM